MKPKVNLTFNISHPFAIKNRCRYCGENKFEFWGNGMNPHWSHNLRSSRRYQYHSAVSVMQWANDTNNDYIRRVLHDFDTSPYHAPSIGFKSYDPRLSRTFSDHKGRYPMGSDYYVVICENCHRQTWLVARDAKKFLPENFNRKALRFKLPIQAKPLQEWW